MAPQKLTEYERRRLENIRRNDEMMAALKIHSKVSQLSAATKRVMPSKSYRSSPEKKKPKTETPVVLRRSLRARGMAPDSKGLEDDFVESSDPSPKTFQTSSPQEPSHDVMGPLALSISYSGTVSDKALMQTLLSVGKKSQVNDSSKEELGRDKVQKEKKNDGLENGFTKGVTKSECLDGGIKIEKEEKNDGLENDFTKGVTKSECLDGGIKFEKEEENDGIENGFAKRVTKSECLDGGIKAENKWEIESCVDLWSMTLEPQNIARVMPGRIMHVKFLPCNDLRMIVAGNKFGNVSFWNVDSGKEEGDGIYMYRPHSAPIAGILSQQSCLSKIYTACYNGFLRLMDAEREVFDLLYCGDYSIFSISQRPNEEKTVYFGEGPGGLSVLDERAEKLSAEWNLHHDRINTIDFSSQNNNIMATSSTDGTVCLWDLRNIKAGSLRAVQHDRAVHSAYFSPSARFLATTSVDDRIGILSGVDFEDVSMIYHYNQTGRWLSSFRAIWGWDDSYVFVGNMKRGVDVISAVQGKPVTTLKSPHLSAIPCRFSIHPDKIGMLAGSTSGGQVYIWT